MKFEDCLMECAGNKELVKEFNRLTGFRMGEYRDKLTMAIDEACGHDPDKEAFQGFIAFVYECIWRPVVRRAAE